MRKFGILLKKELKELITLQVILPLLVTAVIFGFIGKVLTSQQEKLNAAAAVVVIDNDQSNFSKEVIEVFKQSNLNVVSLNNVSVDETLKDAARQEKKGVIVIPREFETKIETGKPEKLKLYSFVNGFSVTNSKPYSSILLAINNANQLISTALIQSANKTAIAPEVLKNPVQVDESTFANDKIANVSLGQVMTFVSQQTTFIPIILFFVIIFSSQMVANAIASEKENKTLETLLTAPVNRKMIVTAKMMAAGLVALFASIIYIFGFRSYLSGLTSGQGGTAMTAQLSSALRDLGLTLNPQGYLLLGISLFAGILVALAIALIIGAFAEDVKSVAGLITPLMVLILIPYIFTLMLDINELSPALKYLVYVIPFSHVFLAAPNIFLHHYSAVIYGIIYQLVFFAIFVYIAARIFSTDLIVTMKLNFSKAKK